MNRLNELNTQDSLLETNTSHNALAGIRHVGDQLSAAREKQRLTVAELSRITRISSRHISAIESGQMPDVAKVYARGYVAALAEYLQLDVETITSSWSAEFLEEAHAETTPVPSFEEAAPESEGVNVARYKDTDEKHQIAPQVAAMDFSALAGRRGSIVTSMVLVVFLAAFVAYHNIEVLLDGNEFSQDQVNQYAENLGPLAHQAVGDFQNVVVDNLPLESTEKHVVLIENQASPNDPSLQPAEVSVDQFLKRVNDHGDGLAFSDEQAPGALDMLAAQSETILSRDRLVIEVAEDSWVHVTDASGKRLYRDLARAGGVVDVSGELPFSLHLGNAPGVFLSLNGKSVPIRSYRADNSTRMTLASN